MKRRSRKHSILRRRGRGKRRQRGFNRRCQARPRTPGRGRSAGHSAGSQGCWYRCFHGRSGVKNNFPRLSPYHGHVQAPQQPDGAGSARAPPSLVERPDGATGTRRGTEVPEEGGRSRSQWGSCTSPPLPPLFFFLFVGPVCTQQLLGVGGEARGSPLWGGGIFPRVWSGTVPEGSARSPSAGHGGSGEG